MYDQYAQSLGNALSNAKVPQEVIDAIVGVLGNCAAPLYHAAQTVVEAGFPDAQPINLNLDDNRSLTSPQTYPSTVIFNNPDSSVDDNNILTGGFAAVFNGATRFNGPVSGNDSVPVGAIIMWGLGLAAIPTNWAICDGTANASGSGIDMTGFFPKGGTSAGSTGGSTSYTPAGTNSSTTSTGTVLVNGATVSGTTDNNITGITINNTSTDSSNLASTSTTSRFTISATTALSKTNDASKFTISATTSLVWTVTPLSTEGTTGLDYGTHALSTEGTTNLNSTNGGGSHPITINNWTDANAGSFLDIEVTTVTGGDVDISISSSTTETNLVTVAISDHLEHIHVSGSNTFLAESGASTIFLTTDQTDVDIDPPGITHRSHSVTAHKHTIDLSDVSATGTIDWTGVTGTGSTTTGLPDYTHNHTCSYDFNFHVHEIRYDFNFHIHAIHYDHNHNHTVTWDFNHNHTVAWDFNHAHTITDTGHIHTFTSASHTHTATVTMASHTHTFTGTPTTIQPPFKTLIFIEKIAA